ncbi:MAG: hypothetical protein IJO48_06900 [Clostridia bacterium]|nr:hypothetical protein [Clostridia bacterium]
MLSIKLGLAMGLVKIPIHINTDIQTLIFRRKKKKKRSVYTKILKGALKWSDVKRVEMRAKIGIKDNAFFTVMMVGFTRILVEKLAEFMCISDKTGISVKPCFATGVFWLYLEGIVTIFPTQIIGILVLKGR